MKIIELDAPLHRATLSCLIGAGIESEKRLRSLFMEIENDPTRFEYRLEKHQAEWVRDTLKKRAESNPELSTHEIKVERLIELWQRIVTETFRNKN